ncbi:MAG: restriction endonuclease [Firmicutes bacterium]|nr:restriction endonuclease [Bacillota bacterium]
MTIWKKGDQRAPHKPLLILYALGQLQNDGPRLLSYQDVKARLKYLLKEFGPHRQSYHPEHPFVRLTNDGIWNLNADPDLVHIKDRWLLDNDVAGGFSDDVYSLLSRDENLMREIAQIILNKHFPETIHADILESIGLNIILEPEGLKNERDPARRRDPRFRERILRAYEYSCAVCGINVMLGGNFVAVEAAHIKWHQAGRPDREENGVALCAMHHNLFDRGVFTIAPTRELIVSQKAHGTNGLEEWLMRYQGKQIRNPVHPGYQPGNLYMEWHLKEVFRGPARYRVG